MSTQLLERHVNHANNVLQNFESTIKKCTFLSKEDKKTLIKLFSYEPIELEYCWWEDINIRYHILIGSLGRTITTLNNQITLLEKTQKLLQTCKYLTILNNLHLGKDTSDQSETNIFNQEYWSNYIKMIKSIPLSGQNNQVRHLNYFELLEKIVEHIEVDLGLLCEFHDIDEDQSLISFLQQHQTITPSS